MIQSYHSRSPDPSMQPRPGGHSTQHVEPEPTSYSTRLTHGYVKGYLAHKKTPPPKVGICVEPYGGSRGDGGFLCARYPCSPLEIVACTVFARTLLALLPPSLLLSLSPSLPLSLSPSLPLSLSPSLSLPLSFPPSLSLPPALSHACLLDGAAGTFHGRVRRPATVGLDQA